MPTPEDLARKNIDASAGELRLESSEARGGTPRQTLRRKPAVEFLMIANQKPDPFLAQTQRNSTIVTCNSYRLGPTIAAQSLQV